MSIAHGFVVAAMIGLAFLVISCSEPDPAGAACPEGLEPFTEFNFYFGLETGDGSEVTEEEWRTFLADIVTPRFPDGLTVLDARGQWLDADANRLYRERTKLLNVLIPAEVSADAKRSLDEIARGYLEQFNQQVVFKTSSPACAGF